MHRWWRVAGAVLMTFPLGALFAWSVFVAPLETELGWSRAQTSMLFRVAVIVFAVSLIAGGRLQDKFGPFFVSILGAFFLSLGLILAGRTESLTWLYVTLGALVGLGNGFGFATPIPVLAKWFPDRRGLAIGIAVGAYGASSAVLAFAAPPILQRVGWRAAFTWFGLGSFAAMTIGAFLLRNPPTVAAARDVRSLAMIRTRQFPLAWIACCLGVNAGVMTMIHLHASATTVLIVGAAGSAAGRIAGGAVSDAVGRLPMLRWTFFAFAVVIAVTASIVSLPLFFVAVFIIHCCYGSLLTLFPTMLADAFGTKHLGENYAWLFTAWAVAVNVGPILGASLLKAHHGNVVFYASAIFSAIAFVCILLVNKPDKEPLPHDQHVRIDRHVRAL